MPIEGDIEAEVQLDIKKEQVTLAVNALLAHLKEKKKADKKPALYDNPDNVLLQITVNKAPPKNNRLRKIPLPHPLNAGKEVCLITKETGKDVKAMLKEHDITCITKVIPLTKLRKEYKSFEMKRQLASLYDVFLCDDRIYHLALKCLGQTFLNLKKEPLSVNLMYKNKKVEIEKTLMCSPFKVGHGSSSVLRVGHTDLQPEQIVDNTMHAIKITPQKIPGGNKNVRAMYLKSNLSVSLPIYQTPVTIDTEEPAEVVAAIKAEAGEAVKNEHLQGENKDTKGVTTGNTQIKKEETIQESTSSEPAKKKKRKTKV